MWNVLRSLTHATPISPNFWETAEERESCGWYRDSNTLLISPENFTSQRYRPLRREKSSGRVIVNHLLFMILSYILIVSNGEHFHIIFMPHMRSWLWQNCGYLVLNLVDSEGGENLSLDHTGNWDSGQVYPCQAPTHDWVTSLPRITTITCLFLASFVTCDKCDIILHFSENNYFWLK